MAQTATQPLLPTELRALAVVLLFLGAGTIGVLPINWIMFQRSTWPDPLPRMLMADPRYRWLIVGELAAVLVIACAYIVASLTLFLRHRLARIALNICAAMTIGTAACEMIAQTVVVGPFLPKMPASSGIYAVINHPVTRPILAVICGFVVIGVVVGVLRALQRPHVAAALRAPLR